MQIAQPDPDIKDQDAQERAQKPLQDQYDVVFQVQFRRHLDTKKEVDHGLLKACTDIFTNFCTKSMQQRIEEHPDFDTTIEDDPIALLEVIKQLQHSPMRAQHPMIPMVDAWTRFNNMT